MPFNILLGVTGSVATIKVAEIVEELKKITFAASPDVKCEVRLVVTKHSKHFLPQPWSQIGASQVYQDEDEWQWKQRGDPVLHIELAKWADVFVIAPLDALTLSKLAHGHCDNLLTCIAMAWPFKENKPFVVCPSMNTKVFRSLKYNFIELKYGILRCGRILQLSPI